MHQNMSWCPLALQCLYLILAGEVKPSLNNSTRKMAYHRVKANGSLQLGFPSQLASEGHSFGNPDEAFSCTLQLTPLHHLQACLVGCHPLGLLFWIQIQPLLFPVLHDCLLQPLISLLLPCFTVKRLQETPITLPCDCIGRVVGSEKSGSLLYERTNEIWLP